VSCIFFESAKELRAEGPADLPKSQAVVQTSAYGLWEHFGCEFLRVVSEAMLPLKKKRRTT